MSPELKELPQEGFAVLHLAQQLLGQVHEGLESEGWEVKHVPGEEVHGPK
jgi:hypothetical protein